MFEIIGTVLVCFVVADFLTGFFHWLEDTYCLEGLPLVGQIICEPNIDHHLDPNLMVRTGSFFSRNLLSWSLGVAAAAALWSVGLGSWPVYLTLLFASFGNEVHRWNHMNQSNRFAEFLKDSGLVQSRKQHSMHHKPPFTSNYCILGSFTNAVLERVRFWRRLETAIAVVTGISPKRENRRDYAMAKKVRPEVHEETPSKQNLAA
jgi:ubiquitin-conjugating enzyme E2 variant